MSLIEIVEKLQAEGHQINYRVRNDGGIIITEINGVKYKGAGGNAQARYLVGATLSEARQVQLQGIKKLAGRGRKLSKPSDDLLKQLRKVQRVWRKNVDKSKGKITLKKLRWNIKHLGIERAKEKLNQAYRYALGLAYDENINALIDYIQGASNRLGNPQALERLITQIKANRDSIREDSIKPAYDELYELNNIIDESQIEDIAMRIAIALNIPY